MVVRLVSGVLVRVVGFFSLKRTRRLYVSSKLELVAKVWGKNYFRKRKDRCGATRLK